MKPGTELKEDHLRLVMAFPTPCAVDRPPSPVPWMGARGVVLCVDGWVGECEG